MIFIFLCLILFISCSSIPEQPQNIQKVNECKVFFENSTYYNINILLDSPYDTHKICTLYPNEIREYNCQYLEEKKFYFYVQYIIQLDNSEILYLDKQPYVIESNGTNKIHNIKIRLRENEQIRTSYIVIENKSDKGIVLCTNGSKEKYRTINDNTLIEGTQFGVYSSSDRSFLQNEGIRIGIEVDGTFFEIPNNNILNSFIYEYIFNGSVILLQDTRPILHISEPNWEKIIKDNTTINKLQNFDNKEKFFQIENFFDKNSTGALSRMSAIACVNNDGTEQWKSTINMNNGNCTLFDMCSYKEKCIVIGLETDTFAEDTSFVALYSDNGVQLDIYRFENEIYMESISKLDDDSFILYGYEDDKHILLKLNIHDNKIICERIDFNSQQIDELTYKIIPFYDTTEKSIYLFCNRKKEEDEIASVLYKLENNGKLNELSLEDKIQSISSICKIDDTLFIGGESVSQTNSSALIMALSTKTKNSRVLFQDNNPYSYISKILFDSKFNELVAAGSCNAKSSYGIEGTPYILALDSETGHEIWKTVYTDEDANVILDFVPCKDYGFIELFANIENDSVVTKRIIRTNATGKIDYK